MLNALLVLLTTTILILGTGHAALAQYDDKLVVLETQQGNIVIEFFSLDAPNHVTNFVDLADSGFYDNTLFHRIIPGFMIQGGDPTTITGDPSMWGTGGPETKLAEEFNTIKHNRGIVSMARTQDPNSAGSQFFIVHGDANFLDQQYTVFGRIVTQQSFETLDKIASLDTNPSDQPTQPEQARILKASVVDRSAVPDLLQLEEPQRVAKPAPPAQNQLYEDPESGITFSAPPGWFLQKLDKADELTPDVIAVGSGSPGQIPPVITLTITDSDGQTLDEIRQEKRQALEEPISAGDLEIISEEESTIHGREALITQTIRNIPEEDEVIKIKFKEVLIYDTDKYYNLTYQNNVDDFDAQLPLFDESISGFKMPDRPNNDQPDNDGGGCLIATAAHGSEMASQVQVLREIRDDKIMNTVSGTAFMTGFNSLYYSFSPTVADLQRQNPVFKEAVKLAITPMLSTLSLLSHAEIDSEYDMITWGVAVIILNAGMYIAAPAVVIYRFVN